MDGLIIILILVGGVVLTAITLIMFFHIGGFGYALGFLSLVFVFGGLEVGFATIILAAVFFLVMGFFTRGKSGTDRQNTG
jgi:hypothetical protein